MSRLARVLDAIAHAATPADRIRLLARSASLLAQAGRIDEARRAADQAERRMTSANVSILHPDVLYAKAAIRLAAGHPDEAVATLMSAAELARESGRRDFLAPCDALLSLALVRCGMIDRAIEHADRSLLAAGGDDHETLFHVWTALARALVADEQYDAALTGFAQARAAALALRDDIALAEVLHGIVECQTAMFESDSRNGRLDPGQVEAALVDNESAARLGERAAMMRSRARARLQRSRLLLLLLRPLEAEAVLRDLLEQQISNLDRSEVNWARALLARCIAERGGMVQARALIEFALAGLDERPGEASVATHRVAAEVHLLLADEPGRQAADAASARLRERLHHGLERSRVTLARVLHDELFY
jgi:tetratricopeptide (TPR) repeat protein